MRRVSQYPYPPQPPYYPQQATSASYYHYAPPAVVDLLAPARRASVLQGILGGLTLICGVLIGAIPHIVDVGELITASGQQIPQLPPGWTMEQTMQLGFGLFGGCGMVLGIALLVFSVFVRKGARGAIIGSMVVTGLILAMMAIRLVAGLVQIVGNPAVIVDLLVAVMTAGLFGLNMYWLAAANRNTGRLSIAAQQYQMQLYAFQQQQQAYAQTGYAQPPQQQTPYGPGAFNYGYASPPQTPPAPQSGPTPPTSNDPDAPPPT